MIGNHLIHLLKTGKTVERNGIHVASEIAEKTVWDKLANENPTHAVISAKDEESARKKSESQIEDIKRHLHEGDILLDVGSGYGRVAQYLLPHVRLGGYVGVDSAYAMLSLFKQRYDSSEVEQRTPVLFLNADIHTLPLKDASVDIAIVCAVFLHNHKNVVKQAVDELKRVMKTGGTVLVYSSFPRSATCMGIQGHLYQGLLNLLGRPYKNGPVRYYRKREIMKLFADFAELELIPHEFSIVPKTLIFLPKPIEKLYRQGFSNPVNRLLEKITPENIKPLFAVHYDVVAKR